MLMPTPIEKLVDAQGRPTFLWDCDVTLDALRDLLQSPDIDVKTYWMGVVMRQARPDDALTLIPADAMRSEWDRLEKYLGKTREFWEWYLRRVLSDS
jgi:hypothetical protein